MTNLDGFQPEKKTRTTIFIDPLTLRRAKAKGALEALTISEVIEALLREYGQDLSQTVTASEVIQNRVNGGGHDISEVFEKGSKLPVTDRSHGEFIDLSKKQG